MTVVAVVIGKRKLNEKCSPPYSPHHLGTQYGLEGVQFVKMNGQHETKTHVVYEARYLFGHIFYLPDLLNWQFFYFDSRDVWQYKNHYKRGPHLHLINHLWPNHKAKSVWKEFNDGNPVMKGAEPIRFDRPYEGPPQV